MKGAITRNIGLTAIEGHDHLEERLYARTLLPLYTRLANELFSVDIPMKEVYSQYCEGYLEWIVPPHILPHYMFKSQPLKDDDLYASCKSIYTNYQKGLKAALQSGTPDNAVDFLVRFTLQCLKYRQVTNQQFDADNCYVTIRDGKLIGIKDRTIMGHRMEKVKAPIPDLSESVHLPRGIVRLNTFDFLDQVKLWMESHREMFRHYESVEYALAILKLRGSVESTYGFQQLMHKGRLPEAKGAEYKWTHELLDKIRDMWDNSNGSLEERYTELCKLVQHLNIPYRHWVKIFTTKALTEDKRLTARQSDGILRGYEDFILYFLHQHELERRYVDRVNG